MIDITILENNVNTESYGGQTQNISDVGNLLDHTGSESTRVENITENQLNSEYELIGTENDDNEMMEIEEKSDHDGRANFSVAPSNFQWLSKEIFKIFQEKIKLFKKKLSILDSKKSIITKPILLYLI